MLPEVKKLGELQTEDFSDRCSIQDSVITLEGGHQVELSCCDTPEKLLGWAYHLAGKRWMDRKLLRYFLKIVAQHHGITLEVVTAGGR